MSILIERSRGQSREQVSFAELLERDHAKLPDREAQRGLRERLRYKHLYKDIEHSAKVIQLLGDAYRAFIRGEAWHAIWATVKREW